MWFFHPIFLTFALYLSHFFNSVVLLSNTLYFLTCNVFLSHFLNLYPFLIPFFNLCFSHLIFLTCVILFSNTLYFLTHVLFPSHFLNLYPFPISFFNLCFSHPIFYNLCPFFIPFFQPLRFSHPIL